MQSQRKPLRGCTNPRRGGIHGRIQFDLNLTAPALLLAAIANSVTNVKAEGIKAVSPDQTAKLDGDLKTTDIAGAAHS